MSSKQEPIQVTLTDAEPRAQYHVTISGNGAAFFGGDEVKQYGMLSVLGELHNTGTSTALVAIGLGSIGSDSLEIDAGESEPAPSPFGPWHRGSCTMPSGCSREFYATLELIEPVAEQSVDVDIALQASLDNERREVFPDDAELTIEIRAVRE